MGQVKVITTETSWAELEYSNSTMSITITEPRVESTEHPKLSEWIVIPVLFSHRSLAWRHEFPRRATP